MISFFYCMFFLHKAAFSQRLIKFENSSFEITNLKCNVKIRFTHLTLYNTESFTSKKKCLHPSPSENIRKETKKKEETK